MDAVDRIFEPDRLMALGDLIERFRAKGGGDEARVEGSPQPQPQDDAPRASQAAAKPATLEVPADRTYSEAFDKLAEKLTNAKEESDMVETLFHALRTLAESNRGWRRPILGTLRAVKEGDKDKAMRFIRESLAAFTSDGRITEEVGKRVGDAVEKNWEIVSQWFRSTGKSS